MAHPLAWILLGALGACSSGAEEPRYVAPEGAGSILIGEVHTLSGPDAARGLAFHRGFELAIEEQNAQGGIAGRTIEVLTLDDRGSAGERAQGVERLIAVERVVLVTGGTSPAAAADIAGRTRGVPFVSPFGAGLARTGESLPWIGCAAERAPGSALDPGFVARYAAHNPGATAQADAAAGYDTGRLICIGMERTHTFDPADLWAALLRVPEREGTRGLRIGVAQEAAQSELQRLAELRHAAPASNAPDALDPPR